MTSFLQPLFAEQAYDKNSFFLLAGPCVVESEPLVMETAAALKEICTRLRIPFVFKASYRKANRSSAGSFTGIGDTEALKILQQMRTRLALPVVTDIHTAEEAVQAAPYVDVLQIPAFLCRQTDLLEAAGRTEKIINIKKGQFLSGPAMKFAAEKIEKTGNQKILLTERGTTFGYQDLVVDFRNIQWMRELGYPVVMDVTHSLQQPNQSVGITGGQPELIETIACAAIGAGAQGIFIETHPEPAAAKSDGANMLALEKMEALLTKLVRIRSALLT
ncbi:MAG: 3-deoxy-8-phosphooctulonate synthase [Sphingomonadales bacterium]|nr:3-deoxy-8-phosphooctulonate synthase [Sphingomonadales bacterium]